MTGNLQKIKRCSERNTFFVAETYKFVNTLKGHSSDAMAFFIKS